MHRVEKRNKRLWIVKGDQLVYTPPDFIRPHLKNRESIVRLAERLNNGDSYIDAVMEFETC